MTAPTISTRGLAAFWLLAFALVLPVGAGQEPTSRRVATVHPDPWLGEIDLDRGTVPDRVEVVQVSDGVVQVVVQHDGRRTSVELAGAAPGSQVIAVAGDAHGDRDLIVVRPTLTGIVAVCLDLGHAVRTTRPPLEGAFGTRIAEGVPAGAAIALCQERRSPGESPLLRCRFGRIRPPQPPPHRTVVQAGALRPPPHFWATILLTRGPPPARLS